MVLSMTAFAREASEDALGSTSCELRSINSRYLDLQVRLPRELHCLEPAVRRRVAQEVRRGKVECVIHHSPARPVEEDAEALDEAVLETLFAHCRTLYRRAGQQGLPFSGLDALTLLRWPGLLPEHECRIDADALAGVVMQVLDRTLLALREARRREGAELQAVIGQRVAAARGVLERLRAEAPKCLQLERERLSRRAEELCLKLDATRLEQELLLLVQKSDIAEEMDRVAAHLEEVGRILEHEAVAGKRLDFMLQELFREANTIGAKAGWLDISMLAVELKVLVEQMREQVQNIE